jgi:hypothetical protein
MIKRLSRLAAGAFVVALGASTLIAQGGAGAAAPLSLTHGHPTYNALRTSGGSGVQPALSPPTWVYKYKYLGVSYKNTFVGTKPSLGAVSTKIPVDIIPVRLTCGSLTTDPTASIGGGNSAIQQTLVSPLFQKSITYTEGVASVKTQYEDAFQKVSLWNKGASATGYHVLFKTPVVKPTVSWTIPAGDCATGTIGSTPALLVFQSLFDSTVVQPTMSADGIPGNVLPIFVTVNSYLADNGGNCCIGGYHGFNGTQSYSEYNYFTQPGQFTEDVSALSHELGEWMDDPFVNNTNIPSSCAANGNGLYEVGDPLENNANFGATPYTVGGFTWNLQDLVTPEYFGAPSSTSANGAETFQGLHYAVCVNGG